MAAAALQLPITVSPVPAAQAALPELRPYQRHVTVAVAEHWAAGRDRVLVVAPTGSGKTMLACALMREIARRGRRVLFLVHRDVLISQATDSLAAWGIACGHIKANYRENRGALVQVGSVQSLARRDWWGLQAADETQPVTLFLDEAHTTGWATVVRDLLEEHPQMRVCGLTATPWRLSRREDMGDVFQAAVCAPFPAALIADGFLVPPTYYGTALRPDLSGVRTRAGDYVEEDLALACDTPEMVTALVDDWQRLAPDALTLAFATNVLHAYHIAAEYTRRGVRAEGIDANTPIDERTRLYAAFRRGEIRVLSSVGVLQEGFDVPEVGCCALARPTKSRALFHQQLGRGLRIAPWAGKSGCCVIDQSGNVGRFGFIEDFDGYMLKRGNPAGEKEDAAASEPDSETKECPTCRLIVKRLTPRCPGCGYLWPLQRVGRAQHTQALARSDLTQADKCALYRDLLKGAYLREYKPESAAVRYREAVGAWPDRAWTRGAVFGLHPTEGQKADYRGYLEGVAALKELDDPAAWVSKWAAAELGEDVR